jgi:hypothetical protein
MRRSTYGLIGISAVICAVLGCSGLAGAATYYVAPPASGGSDSNPGTIGLPWATWNKAITTATAGDTVFVRAGTYTVSASAVTANAGTSASPVTIKAYPGETPTITSSGIRVLTVVQKPYWTFDGLTFIASGILDGEGAIIKVTNYDASHAVIQNCHFQAISSVGHDNVACVMLQAGYASYALIQNNTFVGFHNAPDGTSKVLGIQYLGITGAVGVKILHNTFDTFDMGIYVKHANGDTSAATGAEIAYNCIRNCDRSGLSGNATYINIHDNLFVGTGTSAGDGAMQCQIMQGQNGGGTLGHHSTINHNTLYKAGLYLDNSAGPITYTNVTNNIFSTQAFTAVWRTPTTPHYTTLDYNLYVSGTTKVIGEYGVNYTLATWRTHYGGDANSLSASPIYVGGAAPVTIADYALAAGSPGHNAASDGKDMGADIGQVGIQLAATAVNDSYSVNANHTLTVPATAGVLANDTGSAPMTAIKVTDPSHGSLSLSSDGGFVYTPTAGFGGSDSFTYKANNPRGDSNTATVTITVISLLAGDITGDGYVDGGDLNILLSNWNASNATWASGDLTGDGFVDGGDLNILLSNWNAGTPPAGNAVAGATNSTDTTNANTTEPQTTVDTNATSAGIDTVGSVVDQAKTFATQVNFQPANVVAPQGYLADSGLSFAKAGNGYTYGWTTDLSSFAVQCNNAASLDVRYDTAIMLVAGGTWEMSVSNGMYNVKIVSGAGSSSLATQKFNVEGVPATQIQSQAQANAGWSEETVTIVVTDGKLTIVGNPGSSICFIQITGR